jgi:hypothetical protein
VLILHIHQIREKNDQRQQNAQSKLNTTSISIKFKLLETVAASTMMTDTNEVGSVGSEALTAVVMKGTISWDYVKS